MKMKNSIIKLATMTPSSSSPVLKRKIEITLDAAFPHTMNKDHFTVNATSTNADTPDYVRYMNVISVDDATKKMTVMFGGAVSGKFQMSIRHKDYGLIDCKGKILTVESTVTSYTPNTGSIYGGALLTITGTNFGDLITDNPVSITHTAGAAVPCYVKSSMKTTIKCRLDTKNVVKKEGDTGTMVTFLKTSEEAKCEKPNCNWTYTDKISSVVAMTTSYDAANERYQLKISGTGFTGASNDDVQLEISTGKKSKTTGLVVYNAQTTLSRSATEAVFAITDIPTGKQSGANILVFFPEGVPKGIADVQKGFDFEPKLSKIYPNIGSTAGTTITATIAGIGVDTPVGPTGLQLVDSTGGPICDELKITAYSKIQCRSRGYAIKHPGMKCATFDNAVIDKYKTVEDCYAFLKSKTPDMKYFHWRSLPNNVCASCKADYDGSTKGLVDDKAKGNNVYYVSPTAKTAVTVKQGDKTYACAASDKTKCDFTQGDATSMPSVESLANTDTTIVFTGKNFQAAMFPGGAGVTGKASFMGVDATSVTIDSATQVTATFASGVPTTSLTTQIPKLWFVETGKVPTIHAISTTVLTKAYKLTTSTSGLECSFAGGCKYKVEGTAGLTSLLKSSSSTNYIKMCEKKCELIAADSTATAAYCKVPGVSTTYSNSNFDIERQNERLDSGKYFSSKQEEAYKAFNNVLTDTVAYDKNAGCHVGMEFKPGYVGMITQVKVFLNEINRATTLKYYVNKLEFQGSADGKTYTKLWRADVTFHAGWNYIKFETAVKYRFYRFSVPDKDTSSRGTCTISEVAMTGVQVIDDSNPTYDCPAVLVMNGETDVALNNVKMVGTKTPTINSISPRFGTVTGGTDVTFTGINFVTDISKYSVVIDGINCPVSAATTTSVTCKTGKRPGLPANTLVITVDGVGLVSTRGLRYLYVNLWTDDHTWGGEFQPMDGESVSIPKGLNLLVNVDRTPKLKAVLVEGSLLFMPHPSDVNHQRTFDAMYVFVKGGYMEVGTPKFPYTSKLTMTMHGTAEDPYIPIYGNKVIALREGILEMHGTPKNPAWTVMDKTSEIGDTKITLHTEVDWVVGDQIAIASTSYKGSDADQRFITAIDRTDKTKPILTLDKPLEFKHFAKKETFGATDFIEMRAEVAVLTRNVVYRGDEETSAVNTYGATMFMHSNGDDSLEARLKHIECTNMGQAFKLGRYAIHFHMIGAVHKSYAEGVVVHTSWNRAFTIHGTHYLRLTNNVGYNVKGHTIFIEDAVETQNVMKNNLIFNTQRSWSLLNTDQAPACFWITHPNNNLIGNHCGGSDRYAYWYDLQTHAMGPSANTAVCSEFSKVGIFSNNHAHSCGRYGLRLFHNMIPREYPCEPIVQDYSEEYKNDPFHKNRAVTAIFDGLVSWKNGRNGAICQRIGDVRFKNFKVADNNECGIEIGESSAFENTNQAQIDGALVIGKTSNTEYKLENTSTHGIITGRSDYYQIKNTKFYNFNWGKSAAIGSCSHCSHDSESDSGARTVTFSGMYFDDATVPRRIWYQTPFRAIFYDLDGTFTKKGPKSWVTPYMKHHEQPGCVHDEKTLFGDSTRCDNTVTIRRLSFYGANPKQQFDMMGFKILRYDDDLEQLKDEEKKKAYIDDKTQYHTTNFKVFERPSSAWTTPYVVGHKYKIHWGKVGLDFEDMKLQISDQYKPEDKSIYLVHNFTDVRAKYDIKLDGGPLIEENSIAEKEADQKPGQFKLFPGSPGELHFIVNGRMSNRAKESRVLSFKAHRCIGPCIKDEVKGPVEGAVRLWSKASSWAPKSIPKEGEDVMIESEWNMELDVAGETPIFKHVEIKGILRFSNKKAITLNAHRVFVNGGKFGIGTEKAPYLENGGVTLHGGKNDEAMALQDRSLEAGSKIIANIGELSLFGKKRPNKMTRLLASAKKGDTSITVAKGLDLVKGDSLGLAPTSFVYQASDYSTVEAYNSKTGVVTLTAGLKYYHYGAAKSNADTHSGADMRGEVLILSRNLKIKGKRESTGHGCQLLTADIMTEEGTMIEGKTMIDSIEMENCGNKDTESAAVRFQSAIKYEHHFTNSAVWDCPGWCLSLFRSANINVDGNNFFGAFQIGVRVDFMTNLKFNNNFVGNVKNRAQQLESDGMRPDKSSCMTVGTYTNSPTTLTGLQMTGNIAGGCVSYGFNAPGHKCGASKTQTVFKNNVAHSVGGGGNGIGFAIYPNPTVESTVSTCFEASNLIAYKNVEMGIFSSYTSKKVIYNNIVAIDNVHGIAAQTVVATEDENTEFGSEINNSKIYGDFADSLDCPPDKSICTGYSKCGIFTSQNNANGPEKLHAEMMKHLPTWKSASGSGGWKARALFKNNLFKGFLKDTQGNQKQGIIKDNYKASDHIQMQEFIDTTLEDVDGKYFAYMTDPNPGWANLADCGNFVCTGPKNTLYKFTNNKYVGVAPIEEKTPSFLVVPDTPGYTDKFENCVKKKDWNAYMCVNNPNIGILLFESLDEDRWDRNVAPVIVQNVQNPKQQNKINAFQDYVWDGFYAGQKRLQRFVSLVSGKDGTSYDIKLGGTVPKELRFTLKGSTPGTGSMIIRILYSNAGSRAILKDGTEIAYNPWDDKKRAFGEVTRTTCGNNRYMGEKNILEFYLTEGCELNVSPRDAIQTLVRMEWSVDQFFSEGGTSTFAERLAGSLGIHMSTVKVVSVYEGSLVVNYELAATKDEPLKLEEIQELQTQKFATGKVDVGAPILDVAITKPPSLQPKGVSAADEEPENVVQGGQVVAAGFAPVVLVPTATNTYSKFLWEVVDIAGVATPTEIFQAFMKETMQFILGKNFSKGYVTMDTTASDGEASVIDL